MVLLLEEIRMDMSDWICDHFKYMEVKRYPEADVNIYVCERTGKKFDEFHSPCNNCKYDTSK